MAFRYSKTCRFTSVWCLERKDQKVTGAIKIPGMLSFLSDNNINTKVEGLNEFPKDTQPPMIVHYFFDLMVTGGIFCLVVSGVYTLTESLKMA